MIVPEVGIALAVTSRSSIAEDIASLRVWLRLVTCAEVIAIGLYVAAILPSVSEIEVIVAAAPESEVMGLTSRLLMALVIIVDTFAELTVASLRMFTEVIFPSTSVTFTLTFLPSEDEISALRSLIASRTAFSVAALLFSDDTVAPIEPAS